MKNLERYIKIFLTLVIIGLGYLLYDTLFSPYYFEKRKEAQYTAVKKQLGEIAEAQKLFRNISGRYAADFDTLANVLKFGRLPVVKSIGSEGDNVAYINVSSAISMFQIDPSLPENELFKAIEKVLADIAYKIKYEDLESPTYVVRDTTYLPALDAVQLSTHPDSLKFIPNTPDSVFRMNADVIAYGPARLEIPVFEVRAYNSAILWDESSSRYKAQEGWRLGSLLEPTQEIVPIKN